jgi:hypothetical protein
LNSARLSTGSFSTSRNIAFDDSDVRFSVSSPAGAVGFSCARFLSPLPRHGGGPGESLRTNAAAFNLQVRVLNFWSPNSF